MSPLLTLSTLICVLAISAGQLLFKKAALALPLQPALQDWLLNGWLIASLALRTARKSSPLARAKPTATTTRNVPLPAASLCFAVICPE